MAKGGNEMKYVLLPGLIFVPASLSHSGSTIYVSSQSRRSLYLARYGTNAQAEIFFQLKAHV